MLVGLPEIPLVLLKGAVSAIRIFPSFLGGLWLILPPFRLSFPSLFWGPEVGRPGWDGPHSPLHAVHGHHLWIRGTCAFGCACFTPSLILHQMDLGGCVLGSVSLALGGLGSVCDRGS